MGIAIGIDLGTTNSCVAVVQGGRARVLEDNAARRVHPSIVSFLEDGETVSGYRARDRQTTDPENTVHSAKRLIGRDLNSLEMKQVLKELPYEVTAGPEGIPVVRVRNREVSLPEVSALLLRHLKKMCTETLGLEINEAVITVPANFDDVQRSSTKVAGRIAGFNVLRILNEPTAAALAYGFGAQKTERVAVYDFGGGTFDITIVELADDVFEVLSTGGDTFLGGDDFDRLVAEEMLADFKKRHRIDLTHEPATLQRIRSVAERVKCQLSTLNNVQATLKKIATDASGAPLDVHFQLERARFNQLIDPLVTRSLSVCDEALKLAGIGKGDLDSLVMVGGTTRTPLVRKRVAEHFGITPRTEINPDEVVAIGAAIQAFSLTGEQLPENLPKPKPNTTLPAKAKSLKALASKAAPARKPMLDSRPIPPSVPKSPPLASPKPIASPQKAKSTIPLSVPGTPRTASLDDGAMAVSPMAASQATARGLDLKRGRPRLGDALGLDIKRDAGALPETFGVDVKRDGGRGRRDARSIDPAPEDELGLDVQSDTALTDDELGMALKLEAPEDVEVFGLDIKRASPPHRESEELGLDIKRTASGPDVELELGLALKKSAGTDADALALDVRRGGNHSKNETDGLQLDVKRTPRHPPGDASVDMGVDVKRSSAQTFDLDVKSHAVGEMELEVKRAPDAMALDIKGSAGSRYAVDVKRRGMAGHDGFELEPKRREAGMELDVARSDIPLAIPAEDADALPAGDVEPEPFDLISEPPQAPFIPEREPKSAVVAKAPSMAPAEIDEVTAAPGARGPSLDPGAMPVDVSSTVAVADKLAGKGALLLDVTPRALGVAVAGGYCDIIIERNAAIPVEQSRRFSTSTDNQTEVSIAIYQGESRRRDDNTKLGQVHLSGIRPARRGEIKIKVTFEIDTDGILGVFAVNEETGQAQSTQIVLTGGMDEATVQALVEKYKEL